MKLRELQRSSQTLRLLGRAHLSSATPGAGSKAADTWKSFGVLTASRPNRGLLFGGETKGERRKKKNEKTMRDKTNGESWLFWGGMRGKIKRRAFPSESLIPFFYYQFPQLFNLSLGLAIRIS